MKHWKYLPLKWLLAGIAHLPFWAIYALADFMFVLVYYIVRYRRKVVTKNLTESFPDKSAKEIKCIERQFYRHFADYILETIKLGHITDEQMRCRITFEGIDIIDDFVAQGKSVAVYLSHCGNWEWVPSVTLWSRHQVNKDMVFAQVYRPLKNKWFDEYFLKLRSRFNSVSLPKATVFRELIRYRRDKMPVVTGFMSDQKPSRGDDQYITSFLNHPTAIISGTETIARKLSMAVVYWDITKPSRGHYHITQRVITDDASTCPELYITAQYATLLEQTIINNPHIWLWTHKRWKKKLTLPNPSAEEQQQTHSRHHS